MKIKLTRYLVKTMSLLFFLGIWAVSALTTTANNGSYYEPNAQPPTSVQSGGTDDSGVFHGGTAWDGGLEVGYTGIYKKVAGSSLVKIPRLGESDFAVIETNVTVKRLGTSGNITQTKTGKALLFANEEKTADVGYIFVSSAEARTWVSVLNGNPSFVFDPSKSNVYPYSITDNRTQEMYTAYNLAEIAIASGAGGDPPPGDGLTKIRENLYFKRDGFIATPRPSAVINALQPTYNIDDRINITGYADAYSFYDKHVQVENFVVRNATNDTQYTRIEQITGKKGPHWDSNGNFIFVPQSKGVYEVLLWIKDFHMREGEYPVKRTFTVGDVTPDPDPPDPEPGPKCSINQTTTKMDFQIVGKDVKDYVAVASGGSSIMVEKNAEITLFAAKNGTFTMNGTDLEPGSGNNRKRGIGYFGSSGSYQVVYISDDEKDCWEITFRVKSDTKEDSCPIVTISGKTYRNGDTIEVLPERIVYFQAHYTDGDGERQTADVLWDVTKPDGKVVSLPTYEEEVGGRDKLVSRPYYKIELPFGTPYDSYHVPLERGKTYKVKLNFKGTNWKDSPECDWEVTVVVKDTACTIAEQKKISTKIYGNPPHPFDPGGATISGNGIGEPIYIKNFTLVNGNYETNLGFSANTPGTWYLKQGSQRVQLSDELVANERFDLVLPSDFDVGDWVTLEFESDIGCLVEIKFEIMTDNKCYTLAMGMIRYGSVDDYLWKREVSRGETLELTQKDFHEKYRPRLITREKTEFYLQWLDPNTQQWTSKRNGKWLSSSNNYNREHFFSLPSDPDSGQILEGLYKIQFWTDNGWVGNEYPVLDCEGSFFIQIGELDGENLMIIKSSFTITPKDPQLPGTESTITFQVKNAGKSTHDTKLAVRWESSDKETLLDVNQFKPGETRKITVPTLYPQQSENFIANINPSKNKPDNESIWTDNRAQWPVKVTGTPDPPDEDGGGPGPGGEIPGGQLKIRVYDSGNRLLNLPNDGVWEKETARIEVEIDQIKIQEAMGAINEKINSAINYRKDELEARYEKNYQNVSVTSSPTYWNATGNSMTTWPPTIGMTVNGPGINAAYSLNTKQQLQSNNYTGTTVPTKKDGQDLLSTKYVVTAEGFQIVAKYKVDFSISYEECTEDGDCTSGGDTDQMENTFVITIKGDQTQFEVFDLYVIGKVRHTDDWNKNRQAYNKAKTGDPEKPRYYDMYWAGEKFVLHADTPDTGTSPVKLSSILVTMSTTNLTTPLELTNYFTGDGTLWRENFPYLKDGPYTFTFVATWNHGHVETDVYTIVISDDWTKFFQLHRLH